MKTTLHIALIFTAMVIVPHIARAQPTASLVAAPVDHTKTLGTRALSALSRTLTRRARTGPSPVYLAPSITALSVERRGSRSKVSCTVRVVVTRVTQNAIEARTVVVEARARVLSPNRGVAHARTDCITAAGAEIASRRLAAL